MGGKRPISSPRKLHRAKKKPYFSLSLAKSQMMFNQCNFRCFSFSIISFLYAVDSYICTNQENPHRLEGIPENRLIEWKNV